MAPQGFTHPLLSREGFSKSNVHHTMSICSNRSSAIHQTDKLVPCTVSPWRWENIAHLDWSQVLDYTGHKGGGTGGPVAVPVIFSGLCPSRAGLHVSKSPERGSRGSLLSPIAIVMTTAVKALCVIDVSAISFCLASCHVRGSAISAQCVFLWGMCSRFKRHVIHAKHIQQSCYLLSDEAAFYFVVKQFARPLPIFQPSVHCTIEWLAPPSLPSPWLGHISSRRLHIFTLVLYLDGRYGWKAISASLLEPAFAHLLAWHILTSERKGQLATN